MKILLNNYKYDSIEDKRMNIIIKYLFKKN